MRGFILAAALAAARAATVEHNFVDGECAAAEQQGDLFPDKCEAGAQFTDTVGSDYSLLWEVEYADTYKIVTNGHSGTHHVLHQCGVEPPAPEDLPAYAAGATFLPVPVQAVATTSTTYLPFIEMVGERRALKAYGSSFDYVTSPCLRKLFLEGEIKENAKDEDLEALGVEVTFASSWATVNHASKVEMTNVHETMPLAVLKTAEYVEHVGMFFNREAEATAAIAHIVENWLCTRDAVAGVRGDAPRVNVAWLSYYDWSWNADCEGDGGWNMPSAETWYAEIAEAAGGRLIIPTVTPELECGGWNYLSTAQVLEAFGEADVIIYVGAWDPAAEPFLSLADMPAVANGRVFDNQGSRGANDWFERREVEPDSTLQDFALAFYPDAEALEGLERKYLRDVGAGEEIGGISDDDLDAACPDVDAPYAFTSTDMCGGGPGGSKKKKKSDALSTGAIIGLCVAAGVLVLAGVAAWITLGSTKRDPAVAEEGYPVKVDESEVEVKKIEQP